MSSPNRNSRITGQQFKDRLTLFEKGSSIDKGSPEVERRSKPKRVFSHKKDDADDVCLSSEIDESVKIDESAKIGEKLDNLLKQKLGVIRFEQDMKKDRTSNVSDKNEWLLTETIKDKMSKYKDLAVFLQPVCLVQNDENGKLSIERRIMNEIATIDDPVNVIAIAGPYRSGKSYLLNRLANAQRGFPLGNTTDATTKGIWAWCLEHPRRKDEVLMLLDTEGIGDVEKGDEDNDNNILSLATLLSGTLVYNLIGVVDQNMLENLSFVAQIAKRIALSTTVSQNDLKVIPEIGFFFPSFVLCLRDFSLTIAGDRTPDDYFETCLQVKVGDGEKVKRYNTIRVAILDNFKSRKCFTFDRPAGRDYLARLEDIMENELEQSFLTETEVFVEYMLKCKPKKLMDGSVLNGRMFSSLAEQYLRSIQSGELPCIDDALTIMSKEENTIVVKKAVDMFKDKIESIELPLPDDFELRYKQAQRDALKYFRNMSVLDDNQTFQKKAEDEMDTIKRTVQEKNRAFIKDICFKEFQSMYNILIKPKVIEGTYAKPGGYKEYRDDFARLRENVQMRLPRADSNLIHVSAVEFEGKYRKQDEEILEKADMSESQIKEEIQEQQAKLALEKSELLQQIELKSKEESKIVEIFKQELASQREQEQQALIEQYKQMAKDWQKSKEDLESKVKEQAAEISKFRKQNCPPSATQLQGQKPPMNETVLKTMVSLIPVFGPIAAGMYERFKSK